MKDTSDFFAAWGGISGGQSTLGVLLNGVAGGRIDLAAGSAAISANAADRLRLATKGRIAIGHDADLTIVDLAKSWTLTADRLRYRHRMSALVGCPMAGEVRRVISRGRTVIEDGRLNDGIRGRLLRPSRPGTPASVPSRLGTPARG